MALSLITMFVRNQLTKKEREKIEPENLCDNILTLLLLVHITPDSDTQVVLCNAFPIGVE